MSVVPGRSTVLTFNHANNEPPYLISSGEGDDVEPVLTAYLGLSHHTEFPRRSVISMGQALQAAIEFGLSSEVPGCVQWGH